MSEKKLIEQTAQATAKAVVDEMKRQGMTKDNRQTPFQKTETLLYNYKKFKDDIADKHKEIDTIKQEGVSKKSQSITSFVSGTSYESKTDAEKAEEKIEAIERTIRETKIHIKKIDQAIDKVKHDPYFKLIEMKYFEGKSREQIAAHFGVDVTTISRNKNRLINDLQIRLFSSEYMSQLLG